ncbi:zinc finger protein 512 [Alosa sapidissima]|uniref:zinc finger protein 512 n=1 Tax=Alosa sapidissima TaxID=34773 RepID=UPI001C080A51|nr:zinc finger protein 512 [Alosa sapidissima]
MDHIHNNMSVTYVTTKKKIPRPQLKPNAQVPKTLDRDFESGGIGPSKIEACSQKTQNIKRTYARKKYHDLQPVFMSPPGDPTSESAASCSVIASSLINGAEEPHMSHLGHLGHMGHMAYRMQAREPCCHVMDGLRATGSRVGGGMKRKQPVEEPCRSPVTSLPGVIRESVLVVERTDSSHLMLPSEEPKPKIFTTKKEPPTYPPGSQEERWQLQILGKGRVTCPKCKSVGRKTVEGLKKHMESCNMHPFTCPHCGKQLKSSTGMKYHLMADHNNLPLLQESSGMDDQALKEKLRKILKRMGKLKCSKEGCSGSFTSIMGYLYHTKKCGKEESELEKLLLNCQHCGKPYRSRAGLEYHLKSEHAPVVTCPQTPQKADEDESKAQQEPSPERTPSGRVKRMSAQVAVYHLQEIANDELSKEWPKRKVQRDLVPDDKKLKYARPGLPAFSQEVLRKWKNEVKLQRKVQCPNQGCGAVYTSVSGLKAHLGLCTMGEFEAGKYKCLICRKEFNSESGVKYHINSVHSQEWFVVSKKASKNFEKLLKTKPRVVVPEPTIEQNPGLRFTPGLNTWQEMGPPVAAAPSTVIMANPGAAEAEGKRKEQGEKDEEKERERAREQGGREKDCYDFDGSNSSSSSGGSSSSESEAEDVAMQTGQDTWALKRPPVTDAHHTVPPPLPAKQTRGNP